MKECLAQYYSRVVTCICTSVCDDADLYLIVLSSDVQLVDDGRDELLHVRPVGVILRCWNSQTELHCHTECYTYQML